MLRQHYVGKTLIAILLLSLCLLALSTQSSLWDRDEPRYARVACEMLQAGNWLLPTFNGEVFAHKPPFAFWAMAGSMALFGVNSTAARLPAIFSLAASGWLVFLMGRLLFSPLVGFWACGMLMTSVMAMYLGSAAMVDAPLLAFICLAMYAHLKALLHPKRWPLYWPLLALALGLSELTKHPAGIATAAPAILSSTWLLRNDLKIAPVYWLGLFLAFLTAYGFHQAWHIPIRNTVPDFAYEIDAQGILHRLFSPMQGHGAKSLLGYLALLPLYVPVLLAGFAPWSAFLPASASALAHRHSGSRTAKVFLISWILPIFILFSLAVTKLPHYIFPIFPPVSLLTAGLLEVWRKDQLSQKDRCWLRFGAWLYAPVVCVSAAVLCAASLLMGEGIWRFLGVVPGLVIAASGIWGFRLIRNQEIFRAAHLFLVGTPLLLILSASMTLPAIEPLIKVSPFLAKTIQAHRRPHEPVAICGYTEPSLIFYLNLGVDRPIAVLDQDPEALHAWAIVSEGGWLVVYDSLWTKMIDRFGSVERARTRINVPVLNTNDRAKKDFVRVVQRMSQDDSHLFAETFPRAIASWLPGSLLQ